MTGRRRVVVTGAAGRIGRAVTARLGGRWELVATDLRGEGAGQLDVTDAQACRGAFAGADAVVHLAAVPDPDAGWDELRAANMFGAHSVVAAAVAAGTRRLVLASSLQAMSAYPADVQVRADDPPRPANLYGATKAWLEALGSWAAATSDTEAVALRIGYFAEERPAAGDVSAHERAAWLSPDDCAELVRAAVEGDVDGFAILNGTSGNRYRKALHGSAEHRMGYHPTDDAWSES